MGEREYGPIGTQILFENEQTRVWEVLLEPGGRQDYHLHSLPYLVVTLEGGRNRMTWVDGRVREFEEPTGQVVFRKERSPL